MSSPAFWMREGGEGRVYPEGISSSYGLFFEAKKEKAPPKCRRNKGVEDVIG